MCCAVSRRDRSEKGPGGRTQIDEEMSGDLLTVQYLATSRELRYGLRARPHLRRCKHPQLLRRRRTSFSDIRLLRRPCT